MPRGQHSLVQWGEQSYPPQGKHRVPDSAVNPCPSANQFEDRATGALHGLTWSWSPGSACPRHAPCVAAGQTH